MNIIEFQQIIWYITFGLRPSADIWMPMDKAATIDGLIIAGSLSNEGCFVVYLLRNKIDRLHITIHFTSNFISVIQAWYKSRGIVIRLLEPWRKNSQCAKKRVSTTLPQHE